MSVNFFNVFSDGDSGMGDVDDDEDDDGDADDNGEDDEDEDDEAGNEGDFLSPATSLAWLAAATANQALSPNARTTSV